MRNAAPVVTTSEHLWWTLTCLLHCACHAKCLFPDPLQKPHACHRFLQLLQNPHVFSLLARCRIHCACHIRGEHVARLACSLRHALSTTTECTFLTSQLPKCSESDLLLAFWLRHVLRATTARTFRHLNCSDTKCFNHFDFEMCFAQQQRAPFGDLNFQNCSEHGVLCTFWLLNLLRTTAACIFCLWFPLMAPHPLL